MQSVIAILLVLGGLIFFHELGHFIFARIFGVGVKVFSLGFGPRLAGFTRGQTEYRLSAVPFGGYVAMVGERSPEDLPEGFMPEQSFANKPAWQRMCIVAAGPIFNFVLAFLIFWFLFAVMGEQRLVPVIGQVQSDSPAMAAGLEPGDRVLRVDGETVRYWEDFAESIHAGGDRSHQIVVDRDDKELEFTITPVLRSLDNIFGEKVQRLLIGVVASGETITVPLDGGSALVVGLRQTWNTIELTFTGLVKIVERIVPLDTVGGPIMIMQMVSEQSEQGWAHVLWLAAFISVNLGLLNLMPIPVLDGGHILFFGIEAVTGRKLNERWQAMAFRIGLFLLLMLMALAVYNDLRRIFTAPS